MHATLKEILRNLKRHRGTAEWREPERQPVQGGEVRGFRWEFPNGRALTVMLQPPAQLQVTRHAPDLPEDQGASITLEANQLEALRGHYRWAAGDGDTTPAFTAP